ncbi:MAG: glyoxalase superfamily protein [Bacteroidota bacterium]
MLQSVIPVLRIFDVQKAKEFYIDWLDFNLEWEHVFEENFPVYMEVSKDNIKIHLTEHHGDCTPGSKIFINCNNIQEYCEKLKAKNYKFYKPALKKHSTIRSAWMWTDPFGNRLSFNEYLPKPAKRNLITDYTDPIATG